MSFLGYLDKKRGEAHVEKWDLAFKDYEKGMMYKDIAAKYNVSINTVKGWKTRKWNKKQLKHKGKKKKRADFYDENGLTEKQKNFCLEYLKTFNATKAYQAAYNVDYTTANKGYRQVLNNPDVQAYLSKLKTELRNDLYFDIQDILNSYIKMASADITDFLEFGMEEVTDRKGNIIKVPYIHFKPSDEVDGTLIQEVKIGRDGVSLKLYDKQKAMQELIKLLGGDELRQAQIAKLKALSNVDAPTDIKDDGFIDALNQKGAELWQNDE